MSQGRKEEGKKRGDKGEDARVKGKAIR